MIRMTKSLAWAVLLLLAIGASAPARSQAQGLGQGGQGQGQTAGSSGAEQANPPGGPIRLRQPAPGQLAPRANQAPRREGTPREPGLEGEREDIKPKVSEFEQYVNRLAGSTETLSIRRFGVDALNATLSTTLSDIDNVDFNPMVPQDYALQPGDEVLVSLWGSVDADLRLVVDRSGRISIPRVGPIMVSGLKLAELPDAVQRRVAQVFKNFQLSATVGQLRGLRVYVTGFVARPGPVAVSSLSTLVAALARAGGPTLAGSLRDIQLRRGREVVATLDLYELLLKGDRSADRLLQADDVVHVGPVGAQVAIIGSVNRAAVFELRAGETVDDLLRMAGGFAPVADMSRVSLERLGDRSTVRITELALPASARAELRNGDVLRAFNAVDVALPAQRQNKRVRVDGEVAKPGEYVLPPNSSIADALKAAGGLTPAAYLFGAEFSRESVRQTQQVNYDRALRDLETEFARAGSSQRTSNADEAAAQTARASATNRLVERLRAIRPNGRVVLRINPSEPGLPELALEDGDRLYIPPRPTTVGVFGSVFNAGSFLHTNGRSIEDYLNLAGGPTRGADESSVFVIRADGSVVSNPQNKRGWFSRGDDLAKLGSQPGDTIFVPEEMNKSSFVQNAKDWTQILSQFALGIAALRTIGN